MKCCPGCASAASITMWYSVTAAASWAGERSARSSSAIRSRRSKIFLKPGVSCGLIACSPLAIEPSPIPHTSCMKRLKNTAWRASSTCWVVEEVLLLLQRRRVDVGGEVVRDRVLAPEEQRVVPQRRRALELGEVLAPLARVLGEVELGRLPVAALPARIQILVGDRVRRQARRVGGVGRCGLVVVAALAIGLLLGSIAWPAGCDATVTCAGRSGLG